MEKIKNYLEQVQRDYQEGVALLGKYSKNRMLVNNLLKKENKANVIKLEYELSKLAQVSPREINFFEVEGAIIEFVSDQIKKDLTKLMPVPPMQVVPEDTEVPQIEPAKVLPINADAQYVGLVDQMNQLYTERCKLSNTLEDLETDEQRVETVSKIDAIQKSYNALAVKRNHFDQFGKFPEEQPAPVKTPEEETPMDIIQLLNERLKLRPRVSKAKKALNLKPNDVAKQEKLAKLEAELAVLELQIKAANELKGAEDNGAGE